MTELFPAPDLFRALLYACPAWRSCGLLFAFLRIMPPPLLTKVLFVQYKKHVPPVYPIIQGSLANFRIECQPINFYLCQSCTWRAFPIYDLILYILRESIVTSQLNIRSLCPKVILVFPLGKVRTIPLNKFVLAGLLDTLSPVNLVVNRIHTESGHFRNFPRLRPRPYRSLDL